MKKLMIALTLEQAGWLEKKKKETGASFAEIIRRCIDKERKGVVNG